jgi:hypothetical protein
MANVATYKHTSSVIKFPGMAAWYFLHLDKKTSATIREKHTKKAAGFGSLKVEVMVGKTKWNTSIFPDKRSACYLLPLKASVRKAEQIDEEDRVTFIIKIV